MAKPYYIAIITVCILLFGVLPTTVSSSQPDDMDSEGEIKTMITSFDGVEFFILLDINELVVNINITNPTEKPRKSGMAITLDKWGHHDISIEIKPGQKINKTIDIRESIDPLRDTHNIIFSTYGDSANATFEKDVDLAEPGPIPIPQITDVRIANDTVRGQPSTVAYVTVVNPTNQLYSMKLIVHTEETDGGLYGASVERGESRTIKVELLEERGTEIGGEARLYVHRPRKSEGALDQVEFVGRAGKQTHVYNRSYQPVRGPWMEDPYEYSNDSVGTNNGIMGTAVDSPADVPVVAYLVAALVVLGVVLRRRR